MLMNHTGTQPIETERLVLRRFRGSDAKDIFNNWASDPEVTKHLSWEAHKNIRITKRVLRDWISFYGNPDFYLWAITIKDDDSPIGNINIHTAHIRKCGEVGYCLSRKHWNKGIMTEVLRAVLDFGLNRVGFERIQSYHKTDNIASGRVMQKAGMVHEGLLHKYGEGWDGNLFDCDLYSITKDMIESPFINGQK